MKKSQPITPFNSVSSSASPREKSVSPVTIHVNLSGERNIGQPDALRAAFSRNSYLPSDMHGFKHSKSVKPKGASYEPRGAFGKPKK